jgi:hypothetical protein
VLPLSPPDIRTEVTLPTDESVSVGQLIYLQPDGSVSVNPVGYEIGRASRDSRDGAVGVVVQAQGEWTAEPSAVDQLADLVREDDDDVA